MKRIVVLIFIIPILGACVSGGGWKDSGINPVQQQVPFTKGVTFTHWFEFVGSVQGIHFSRYNEQTFADVKGLDVDVIRLPIDFSLFASGAPDYEIDPLFFKFLDMAVDWAVKYQIYIIFDNHPASQPPVRNDYRNFLIPVWTQMAEHYKNRNEYVIYEILNEPNRISANAWGKMQGGVVDAIRKVDKNHWIVVSGIHTGNNPAEGLSFLPKYSDNKLLYTFHFYDPHVFTHQGVAWTDLPQMASLGGVPFPYDKERMPKTPNDLKGTWVENELMNYSTRGTTAALTKKIDQVTKFIKQRNVPVFCGEFGVYMCTCLPEDRVMYYRFIRESLEARNIPWLIWDYYYPFGIFDPPGGVFIWGFIGDIKTDLNIELVRALGLVSPPQAQRQREPLNTGFTIYDDRLNKGSTFDFSCRQTTINLYYTPAAEGEYAIHWGNISRKFDFINFQLAISDFSYLAQNRFALEFKAKTGKPVSFDVKFFNLQDNTNWHIGYNITSRQLPPDEKWHIIRIPLMDMKLWGGDDKRSLQWVEPGGRTISWDNINNLEFTMVNEDGYVCEIYLDDIKITE